MIAAARSHEVADVATAATGTGGIIALIQGAVLELFGVPLPVVLGAMCGAFAAQRYIDSDGLAAMLGSVLAWTGFGVFLVPFTTWAAAQYAGVTIPAPAQSGAAFGLAFWGWRLVPAMPVCARLLFRKFFRGWKK